MSDAERRQFTWRKSSDKAVRGVLDPMDSNQLEEAKMGHWSNFSPLPRGAKALAQDAVDCVKYMAQEALIDDKLAMAEVSGPAEYLVDNSQLQAHAPGITFRFSKDLADRDDLGELAAFGSVVLGIDEGDGWLRAQNPSGEMRFLPMEISGVLVLSRTGAEQQREAQEERRRRKDEAERHQRDLEAWQRRAAEAERLHQQRERHARTQVEEDPKADLLKPSSPRNIRGRTEAVLERHYAGEEEEAPDHYQVLGISRHASLEEITQAYRALSKLYHPDRLKSSGGMLSQAAAQRSHEQQMAALNAAKRVLSDARLRHAYDKTLPEEDVEPLEPTTEELRGDKSQEQYDFDFMGSDRPFRSAKGRAARAAKACGSRDQVRLAMEQLRGKEKMTLAEKDGQIRPTGPNSPFSGLGSCADPDCRAHRLAWPQVRTSFRDFIVKRIRDAHLGVHPGCHPWWHPSAGLRYTSIGSGQLLFDLELIERIRYAGVRIAQICLVDPLYAGSPPSVDVRRALREFTDWQRAAAQLCRHEPAEVLVFSEVWDYYESCCESESNTFPDSDQYRQPCDLLVHCDAAWPGADEELEQLAQVSLSRGGLFAQLSNQALAEVTDLAGNTEVNSRGHSLTPLMARAWVQMDAQGSPDDVGYCPSRPSQPLLVEVEDELLASCREAIEDTKTSEPRYDLQMARILAEAREKAQQEARKRNKNAATGGNGNGTSTGTNGTSTSSRKAFEAPVRPPEPIEISFRQTQPPFNYFRERQTSRHRVPGKGSDIQKGQVFERFKFLNAQDDIPEGPRVKKGPTTKMGLSAWKVIYSNPVAMRATPKATGRLVGQLHPGDVAYCNEKQRSGDWLKVEEVPGQTLGDDAWVLVDGTDFGMGLLLQKVEK